MIERIQNSKIPFRICACVFSTLILTNINYQNFDIEVLPPIIIKDNYLNYYYSDYKYTKIIKEYPDTTFLLLIDNFIII